MRRSLHSRPVIRSKEDILSERYAKGELTREQYIQMKEDLKRPLEITCTTRG